MPIQACNCPNVHSYFSRNARIYSLAEVRRAACNSVASTSVQVSMMNPFLPPRTRSFAIEPQIQEDLLKCQMEPFLLARVD